MSSLPSIDAARVEEKLLARINEQTKQAVHLEVLAEALRDERDTARQELGSVRFDLQEAQAERDELTRRLNQLTAPQDDDIIEGESWNSQ